MITMCWEGKPRNARDTEGVKAVLVTPIQDVIDRLDRIGAKTIGDAIAAIFEDDDSEEKTAG